MPEVFLVVAIASLHLHVNRESFKLLLIWRVLRHHYLALHLAQMVQLATEDGWEVALDGLECQGILVRLWVLVHLEV